MTVRSNTIRQKTSLDTPITSLFVLNWEIVLYVTLFILALVTRFYDLGARVMSHDESLHTLYSWNLYAGKGYQHDPLMHGPFLFHITALIYFLFGDNDFTARIATALLGAILVILPYWFRPWLGRIGALSTSLMILISPGLLYYSRYIRHDIFVSVWTVLIFLAFFQFMRTRGTRWLYIGAVAVALMLSTKEISYIHGYIGFSFIAAAYLWESLPKNRRLTVNYVLLGIVFVLVAAKIYVLTQAGELAAVAEAEGEASSFAMAEHIDTLFLIAGLLIGLLLIQLGVDRTNRPVTMFVKSLLPRRLDIGKAVIAAVVVFVVLHTTFFSNIGGLYSGTIGAITYWLDQHDVQRGGQPWYYYLFLVPLYEFLPVIIGLVGGLVYLIRRRFPDHNELEVPTAAETETDENATAYWPSDGGTFAIFLIYWAFIAFSVYSWAGEKMPWLTVHMTLPLIFLSGHVIQTVLDKFNWAEARQNGGLMLAGALLLIPAGLIAIGTSTPFQSQSLQSINETLQFIAGVIVLLVLAGLIWTFGRRLGRSTALRVAFITGFLFLALLTVRFTWLLNYVNYDYVNEILVYAHASPDVKLALNQIDEISRRTVGDKMIRVAYDNDSTWPLEWYMREYPNRVYYGENPTREALDSPVVIVGSANESKVKPYLGDQYTRYNYRLVWWPVEDYKNQTLTKLWQTYVTGPPTADAALETPEMEAQRRATAAENRRKLWNIIFYRDYQDYDLNEWPFVHRFSLYVRNDVLTEVWDYQSGPIQLTAPAAGLDPYDGKRLEVNALQSWGSEGSGDGQFTTPRGVAVAPNGNIYVADSFNHRIQVLDPSGQYRFSWGGVQGSEDGQFNEPWGVAVGPDGKVYVADTWNHRVQIFDADGNFIRSIGTFVNVQTAPDTETGNFWGPRDIAVDSQGNFYVTDTGNKRIQKFDADGNFLETHGGGGIIAGSFEEPVGIAIDSNDNIYVADTWNHRIQKFDSAFNPLLQWDVKGWDTESVVNKPYIAVDDQDRVIISDPEGYRLIAYDGTTGDVLATWGQYGQDLSSFQLPVGVEVDSEGNILVVDSDSNRIMQFQFPTVGTE